MAAGKSHKQKQQLSAVQSTPHTRSQPPATPAQQPPPSATTAKKSKKKKGKGKEPASSAVPFAQTDFDGDLYDDMPSLEEPQPPVPPKTGLSPMLESVHVTATTISRSGNGTTTRLQTELLGAHVNQVDPLLNGKRFQSMPHPPLPKTTATNGPGIVDEEYWSSFPPHIKNFVRKFIA